MEKVTLSRTGQLVLPKSILEIHQWGEGVEFLLWDTGNELVIKPVAKFPPSRLEPPDTPSVYKGPPLSLEELDKVIESEAGNHK
jgi:bifunctional DNA-binding transcriptional regulator/antitoxin component of YhaV-PrlF toxin-antitoxin module